jgi:uroporphyrin-III C-methyltransferase
LEELAVIELEKTTGKVYLIGAGPGDPKLLTLRAAEVLHECDTILVDRLVNREILKHARPTATVLEIGKRAGEPCITQEEINSILVERASLGEIVGRLKGGDPFVFGRGAEEAEALVAAGIPWEVIPGVTAGIGAASYAGIPILHRKHSSSVTFVTGHGGKVSAQSGLEAETLVVFMGGNNIGQIAAGLLSRGRPPSTRVAIVQAGSTEQQAVFTGTLAELAELGPLDTELPMLAVIGDVVSLASKLHWFGDMPRPLREVPERPRESAQEEHRARLVHVADELLAVGVETNGG